MIFHYVNEKCYENVNACVTTERQIVLLSYHKFNCWIIRCNSIQQLNFLYEFHIPLYDQYQQLIVFNRSITIVKYDNVGKNKFNQAFSIVILKKCLSQLFYSPYTYTIGLFMEGWSWCKNHPTWPCLFSYLSVSKMDF